ncbi:MAG: DUF3352 domain-containing protein [Pirellulaceae bacterium]
MSARTSARSRRVPLALVLLVSLVSIGRSTQGERPRAPSLLPENTCAYLRIGDAAEFLELYRNTSIGRVLQDPQMQPLVNQLYGSIFDAFRERGEQWGLSLDEIIALARGEVSVALVTPDRDRRDFVLFVEVGDQLPAALTLIERILKQMELGGATRTTVSWDGTDLILLEKPDRSTVFFQRDNTIAVVTDLELAKQMLTVWNGAESRTLANKSEFGDIMDSCAGASGDPPQLTYFVDPLGLINSIASDNAALRMGVSVLEVMGLGGLRGFGGSLTVSGHQYDSIHHMHLLMDTPPKGVLEVLALRSGDVTPEPWVPGDVASYTTVHWDFQRSYSALNSVYDIFRGEGAWVEHVDRRITDELGVDLQQDIFPMLEGRLTHLEWLQKPARPDSHATLFGVKLKDANAFRQVLTKMLGRAPSGFVRKTYAGVTYYQVQLRSRSANAAGEAQNPPDSYVTILGDYLLLTNRLKLLEHTIDTKRGSASPLSDELDFKLIASKISRQLGQREPGMIFFKRPYETFRNTYELLGSDDTRQRLSVQAERSRVIKAVHEALSQNPLPPFDVVMKYLAPTGGFLTSDATGIHGVRFTLKRE